MADMGSDALLIYSWVGRMKFTILLVAIGAALVAAEEREKRQVNYQFPGPRNQPQQQGYAAAPQDDSALYQTPRRQFQAQPVQAYAPQQRPAAPPSYQAPQAPARRPPAQYSGSTGAARTRYSNAPQQQLTPEEEEEQAGPDPLALLLEGSKFGCSGKKDGYYADNSVNCQAFHYCVGGARHSWMCPAGTVFHQVHLNCVPASQDICSQSEKFHFVNDYLYKPLDYQGPNNTARYHQRYYPEGYSVGDTLIPPQQEPQQLPSPVYQPQQRPQPQQQAYRQPAAAPQGYSAGYTARAPQPAVYQTSPPAARAYQGQPARQAQASLGGAYGAADIQIPGYNAAGQPQPRPQPAPQAPPARRPPPQQSQAYGYGGRSAVRYDDDQSY